MPAHSNLTLPLYAICVALQLPCTSGSVLYTRTFEVSGPLVQPTLTWVGEDVLLPCHLSPKMDARKMTVKWVRGPLVVHFYHLGQEVEEVQAPLFQGRTTMLRQDISEGKVTVLIHQVQLSHAGRYTCYFQAGAFYNETSFDLQVAERKKEPFSVTCPAQSIQAKQGEDVTLSCELSPKMDAQDMTVKWFRNQTLVHRYPTRKNLEESQGTEFQGKTELLKHDMAQGKVTLRIQQVQVADSGLYTCQLQSPDYHSEAHMELQVAENLSIFPKILPIAVLPMIFTGSYFFYQTKLKRTTAETIPGLPEEGQRSGEELYASPEKHQFPCKPTTSESTCPFMTQKGEVWRV